VLLREASYRKTHSTTQTRFYLLRIISMGLAIVQSRALIGLTAHQVTVEVHMANGLPTFTLVGLAETEVKEARERVRCAILNAGFQFPHNQRITVNLAPADIPKESGRFDLPIALGILAASGQMDAQKFSNWEFAGELSLTGQLRPIRGALAMALALRQAGEYPMLVLPTQSAEEAALMPDLKVWSADNLIQVVQHFSPSSQETIGEETLRQVVSKPLPATPYSLDMADVKGQAGSKRALEIAAAGGHSVLMVGPPGSGKSMLAHRFSGLLPKMEIEQALQSAAIRSLAGRFDIKSWAQRPTSSPHHTASSVALVGGGSPPRPGEISLAHHGVLFLDELPEFSRSALEALREPLETGAITIIRATQRAEFPARFQLIAAMNPCPCGFHGAIHQRCRCSPDQVSRYQNKLSGPFLDRIDLHIEVPIIRAEEVLQKQVGEASAIIRQRCQAAHQFAYGRQGKPNSELQGHEIDDFIQIESSAMQFLQSAAGKLGWSARATHRTLKVARTIADLSSSTQIATQHVAESIQYRRILLSK
jgi:magnesium chelatase family protein